MLRTIIIKKRIDDAIEDEGLQLVIYRNNLYPDYYPIEFEIASEAGDINISANGFVDGLQEKIPAWKLNINQFLLSETIIDFLHKNIEAIPEEVTRIGMLKMDGLFSRDHNGSMAVSGNIGTGIGDADIDFRLNGNEQFEGTLTTPHFDLKQLTGNEDFGTLVADLSFSGKFHSGVKPDISLNGLVS